MQWVKDKEASPYLNHGISSLLLKDRDERKEISSICIVFASCTLTQSNDINDYCF